jgi:aspartyl-tRNA(Asn)/glutamyl-tRNA(Gln) amidotransferase subunit A
MTLIDAESIRRAVAAREMPAVAVCTNALEQIHARNPQLNAFLTVADEQALARARQLDRPDSRIETLPLAGVPVAVKDNICTRGVRTTAGSRMLADYVPPYSATVIDRLEAAGAIIVGKTNCDEFGMGSSTEHSAFGPARNPHALDRTPGGSSGGSAAAVAAGLAPVALGSETGGSVRQPAALCGVVGLKPTYGRVSRYGLIAFSSSMDQVGVFARNAADAARVLRTIAGEDPRDATAARHPVEGYELAARSEARGLRVGVPRAFLADGIEDGVRESFAQALERLRSMGVEIQDVELPHARYATPTYAIVAMAEASSNLARYDGVRYGHRGAAASTLPELYAGSRAAFGKEVKRRLLLGTYVLSGGYYEAYYAKAQQVRALMRRDYDEAFARVDLIATPTSPTTAFPLGSRIEDPLQMYLADVFTASANLTGLPAISVPCGSADRLPVGLQLTGRMWEEGTLLRAAAVFDRGRHQP